LLINGSINLYLTSK